MTVSTTTDRISILSDGSTTVFSFPFPAVNPSFIQVFLTTGGITTQLAPNTFHVTLNPPVAPNPTSVGGTVTYPLVGSPLAVGYQVTIVRVLPQTQTVSLANQSIVYPAVVEQEFDYLTMMRQTSAGDISRCFQVGPSDPPPALVPSVAARANMNAGFDGAGNLTAVSGGGGGGGGGTIVSAAMIPVVTAATLPLAQVAMGVAPVASPVFTGDPQAPTPAPGDNDTSVATTAFVQALVAGTVGATVFTTGDLKPTHKATADVGWIMWVDGTIGDASSGSSVRSNADTSLLFALYYNNYPDANCPLLTSGGASTTRAAQGTASAAFAAHCRMTLPRGSGRTMGISGTGAGLTSRQIGQLIGEETHTQSIAEMPSHVHNFIGQNSGLTTNPIALSGSGIAVGSGINIAEIAMIQATGGGAAFNVMQPTTFVNVMVKL